MLSNNKKLSESTAATALCSGTVVHGRRFHHAHSQTPGIRTAAQSNQDRKERKEYPPYVHKAENSPVMLSHGQGGDHIMKKTEESESYVESEIKRKVQQKRHCSTYQLSPLSPASKKCLTHLEVSEQREYCPKCGKEKENQTKCQSCGIVFHNDLQRNCRQAVTLNEPTGPLLRTSIHQNSGGQKSQNTGLTAKKFYGNSVDKIPIDILVTCDDSSDDGLLADENYSSEIGQWHLKPTVCKQPCILLMDSLRGPSRSNVVKILREYLEVEWEVKKGSKRSFSKDVMKGSNPKVPQQNNFSDCGVYVLQYVESFFENPVLNFELPMNLVNWFPPPRMKTKREEIRNIILKLQESQSKDKKLLKDSLAETSLGDGAEQYASASGGSE